MTKSTTEISILYTNVTVLLRRRRLTRKANACLPKHNFPKKNLAN